MARNSRDVSDYLLVGSRRFRNRALGILPSLGKLALSDEQWQDLEGRFIRSGRQRLSGVFLIENLLSVLKIGYTTLNRQLKQTSERSRAPVRKTSLRTYQRKPGYHRFHTDENRLIVALPRTHTLRETPLKRLNARIVRSPDEQDNVLTTPGGKTRANLVYEKKGLRVYRPQTPGRVRLKLFDGAPEAMPKLKVGQARPIKFTASLDGLFEQEGRLRTSQKQLAGVRCQDVFSFYTEDNRRVSINDASNGRQYHWSHLIAHFLGGDASPDNLTPTTAASNYETLNLIERFIADQLNRATTKNIHIKVVPHYQAHAVIADALVYTLKWQETGADGQTHNQRETIIVRPMSHTSSTFNEKKTFVYLRTQDWPEQEAQDTPDDHTDESGHRLR